MRSQEAQPQCSEHCDDHCKCQRTALCQVEGCEADLLAEKRYCVKKRVCSHHMQADEVYRRDEAGQAWRFCFQCGKLEHLERFDGTQRSCRSRLELRRKPKRSSSSSSGAWGEPSTARKCKRSKSSKSSKRCASRSIAVESDTECDAKYDGQHRVQEQKQGRHRHTTQQQQRDATQWQYPGGQQSPFADSACGGFETGFTAESFGEVGAPVAVLLRQQSSTADVAPSITRTSTAVSASAVAALLADQVPTVKPEAYSAAAALSAAPTVACSLQAIPDPAMLHAHMASLQQQYGVLQAQLNAASRAGAGADGRSPAGVPAGCSAAAPSGLSAKGVGAMLPSSVLSPRTPAPAPPQQQQQQQLALQRFASGPAYSSAESALTAVVKPGHMNLAEMVVAQLDHSSAFAEAAALEALLDRELRAAAVLPPEHAQQHAWATQLNDVINSWSDAIMQSAGPSSQSGSTSAPSAEAPALRGPASMLALQRVGQGLGYMASPAAYASRAIPDRVFSARLALLQGQLEEMQRLIATSLQRIYS